MLFRSALRFLEAVPCFPTKLAPRQHLLKIPITTMPAGVCLSNGEL
jgi:hypothetical protein